MILDAHPAAPHGQNPERRQTTSQQRHNWAPPCDPGAYQRVDLYGQGRVTVDKRIVPAVEALSAVLERHSYETRRGDTGAYNCRKITGGTGYSLHAYGIALDINWQSNPYGPVLVTDMPREMVDEILAITTTNGARVWEWGGDWRGNKDAMHYEIDCTPDDLATGLQASEEDAMTPEQEHKVDRLLASNTRIEKALRTIAGGLAKVEGIVQSDYETDLITLAEQRDADKET